MGMKFDKEFSRNCFTKLTGNFVFNLKIAGSEMPFIDQPHLDTFSDLIFRIDDCYDFNVHQAFMCTRTEYFSALVKNHFNEMLPNSNKQNNGKSTMILRHIRKELFLPLLYYIYTDECEVRKTSSINFK
jgi:hypothetical protein